MTRIRLADLEAVREDITLLNPGNSEGYTFGMSAYRLLQLAIYRYHRVQERVNDAVTYLEDSFQASKKFTRQATLDRLIHQLQQYDEKLTGIPNRVIEHRIRTSITISDDLTLYGEVPRVDLVPPDGYAVWLFAKEQFDWTSELRMPIIQNHFARERFGVSTALVSVGFYFFDIAEYESATYSAEEIAITMQEATELGTSITAI